MGWAVWIMWVLPVVVWAETPDPHYCAGGVPCEYSQAFNFVEHDKLDPKAQILIKSFFDKGRAPSSEFNWNRWTELYDDKAAALYSITLALSRLYWWDGSHWVRALDVVDEIIQVEGVRIYAKLNQTFIETWRRAGARFQMPNQNGKVETGKFNFNGGDIGGSLHKGFDVQGYTSCCNEPRVQVNYRNSDGLADIDLDIAGWIWHFIPNPKHLTYAGSDTRDMYKKILKKFGYPGFQIRKVSF
jgi:hypothetical protein